MNNYQTKIQLAIVEFTESYNVLNKEYRNGMNKDEFSSLYQKLVENYYIKIAKISQEELCH